MKLTITVGGRPVEVELVRTTNGWRCQLNGQSTLVDVVEAAPGVLSVLLDGQSFTVRVERHASDWRVHLRGGVAIARVEDPRRWPGRSRGADAGLAGRQEVKAPMSGKVVRVLVRPGQEVEAGQGVAVVEAMKMQNEIPSPKKGEVEQVRVQEGDTVEHGTVLAVIT
ncbi:MAG TPA: biotin/lipoyl-containing protein [Candidatus Xenobia bacterium]|nr:biotin/lipoyl-containing protein [Candidatus Xenobia bacterium]